jgi:type I restriction enzyme M protein
MEGLLRGAPTGLSIAPSPALSANRRLCGVCRECLNARVISFDAQVRSIHDHLYSSANIRVPEDLQLEVAKVVQTLTWLAVVQGPQRLDGPLRVSLLAGDKLVAAPVARELRDSFAAYNKTMRRYTREEAVLRLDDASLAYIVAALDGVDMSDASRDWLGDALEVFRSTAAKRLGGQFFTDQRVTTLAIRLLSYSAAEDDLVDICAGTGGFLIAGARAAQAQGSAEAPRLIGVEVDGSLAHLANSTLHHLANFPADAVFNADSFRTPDKWPLALRKTVVAGTHRCLASNPPFGQKITIKDPEVLRRFDLGHIWSKDSKGWEPTRRVSATPPDILFIERNVQLAQPGDGRIALVVPYQVLSGPKLGYVREWILRHTRIRAIVDLPEDTFQPWTGTKTALLVMERREKPLRKWEVEDYPVFMARSREIGHDRRGNPKLDADGRIRTDLGDVGDAYAAYEAGESPTDVFAEAFVVSALAFTAESDLRLNAAFHEPSRTTALNEMLSAHPDEYQVTTIGAVTKRVFFPGRFKRNYVPEGTGGIPFYGGTNITQLVPTNRKYLSPDDPRINDFRVEAGWLLVTRSGSTGIVSTVPTSWHGHAMSEHVIRIEVDEDLLPGAYVEAYLRSDIGQALLSQGIFGSVIDEITPEHIQQMPIPIPQDPEMLRKIVDLQSQATELRQQSIALYGAARSAFEESVGRDFFGVRQVAKLGLPPEDVVDEGEELSESEVVLKRVGPGEH